jgi:CBS domain-containing protein
MYPSTRGGAPHPGTVTLEVQTEMTGSGQRAAVRCPVEHRSTPLGKCVACERCVGIRLEPHSGRSVIVCRSSATLDGARHRQPAPQALDRASATSIAELVSASRMTGSASPIRVPSGESVARAAALMAFEKVDQIGVVAPDGAEVGTISARDILRWVAKEAGFVLGDSG